MLHNVASPGMVFSGTPAGSATCLNISLRAPSSPCNPLAFRTPATPPALGLLDEGFLDSLLLEPALSCPAPTPVDDTCPLDGERKETCLFEWDETCLFEDIDSAVCSISRTARSRLSLPFPTTASRRLLLLLAVDPVSPGPFAFGESGPGPTLPLAPASLSAPVDWGSSFLGAAALHARPVPGFGFRVSDSGITDTVEGPGLSQGWGLVQVPLSSALRV